MWEATNTWPKGRFGGSGRNIAAMNNASRGEFSYNLVDAENEVPSQVAGEIAAILGILSVRVI